MIYFRIHFVGKSLILLGATPLKVLIVSDSEDDALLLSRELKRGGFQVNYLRVDTERQMINALKSEVWDLVISDYMMQNFSGLDALKVLKWQGVDLPFILISDKVGEEIAVEAMKAGANDYILKDKLVRLVRGSAAGTAGSKVSA